MYPALRRPHLHPVKDKTVWEMHDSPHLWGDKEGCAVLRLELPRGLLTKIVERIPCLPGLVEEFLNSRDCSSGTVGGELLYFVSPSGTPMAE